MNDTTPDAANLLFEQWQRRGRVQWLATTMAFDAPAIELDILSRLIFCDLYRELTGQEPAHPTGPRQGSMPLYGQQPPLWAEWEGSL